MRYVFSLFIFALLCIASHRAFSQIPSCELGHQAYAGMCISNRMADYIACIAASGGNKQEVEDIVKSEARRSADSTVGAAIPKMRVSPRFGLTLDYQSERQVVSVISKKWFAGATDICLKVLPPQSANPNVQTASTLSTPKFSLDLLIRPQDGSSLPTGSDCAHIKFISTNSDGQLKVNSASDHATPKLKNYFRCEEIVRDQLALDIKISNPTDHPLYITRAILDVDSSVPIREPYLMLYQNNLVHQGINLINLGSMPPKTVSARIRPIGGSANYGSVEFTPLAGQPNIWVTSITPYLADFGFSHAVLSSFEREYVKAIDGKEIKSDVNRLLARAAYDSLADECFSKGGRAFSGDDLMGAKGRGCELDFEGYIEYTWRDNTDKLQKRSAKVETRVTITPAFHAWGDGFKETGSYDFVLKSSSKRYRLTRSISQVAAANSVDRFLLFIDFEASSAHHLRVQLYTADGLLWSSKPIQVTALRPRP